MDLGTALLVGAIQGITEWLPVSSEAMVALTLVKLLGKDLSEAVLIALGLHIGTLLAAVVYFRRKLKHLGHALFRGQSDRSDLGARPLAIFLLLATLVTIVVASPLAWFSLDKLAFTGTIAMALVGSLLLITGLIQILAERHKVVTHARVNLLDAFLLGVVQGIAILPGLSRSGLTISTFLLRRYAGKVALEVSFLLSIPIVAIGALLLLITGKFVLDAATLLATLVAFVVGLLTIGLLLRIAEKVRFGWLCVFLGLVTVSPLFLELF